MSDIKIENGIVVGTVGKYQRNNAINNYLIKNFDKKILRMVKSKKHNVILEIGCGEGHITELIYHNTRAEIIASDFSKELIQENREKLQYTVDRVNFVIIDVLKSHDFQLVPNPDMVVCCEVLEHLSDPVIGIENIKATNASWYIFSVPWEPIFRMMNCARGAYWKRLGSSPGHIQHWTNKRFLRFLKDQGFRILDHSISLPWTLALCEQA